MDQETGVLQQEVDLKGVNAQPESVAGRSTKGKEKYWGCEKKKVTARGYSPKSIGRMSGDSMRPK